jgi:hypothetical protein
VRERDAAEEVVHHLQRVLSEIPTELPQDEITDNHGDTFTSGWDSGERSLANQIRVILAARAATDAAGAL